MKMTIQGMGLAAPFGDTEALRTALTGSFALPELPYMTDTAALGDFVPSRKLRRIDHFTRMALLAAYRALKDAGQLESLPENMGIILSTGYGPSQTTFDFLDSIIEDGASLASPLAFSHSVHNIPAGVLSMLLGRPCPQTTICQLFAPVTTGLQTAALWLTEGRVDSVLFGAVDETTPLLEENTNRLHQKHGIDETVHTGEGAAFFLLDQTGNNGVEVELKATSHEDGVVFTPADLMPLWGTSPIKAAFTFASASLAVDGSNESLLCVEDNTLVRFTGAGRD